MKTRLNILTMIIAFALGLWTFKGLNNFYKGFKSGFEQGDNKRNGEKEHSTNTTAYLEFDKPIVVDSVFHESSNSWVFITADEGKIKFTQEKNPFATVYSFLFVITSVIMLIIIVVLFLKIINTVKSGVFFDRRNIRRLRKIGGFFIFITIGYALHTILELYGSLSMLKDTPYFINTFDYLTLDFMIYGLLSLLIAEILAFGLKLKEEQDLTI